MFIFWTYSRFYIPILICLYTQSSHPSLWLIFRYRLQVNNVQFDYCILHRAKPSYTFTYAVDANYRVNTHVVYLVRALKLNPSPSNSFSLSLCLSFSNLFLLHSTFFFAIISLTFKSPSSYILSIKLDSHQTSPLSISPTGSLSLLRFLIVFF